MRLFFFPVFSIFFKLYGANLLRFLGNFQRWEVSVFLQKRLQLNSAIPAGRKWPGRRRILDNAFIKQQGKVGAHCSILPRSPLSVQLSV